MFLRPAFGLMTGLSVLLLSGCTDTLPDPGHLQTFKELIRGDDGTLTRAEKEAAISELQADKKRQQAQTGQADGAAKTN